MTDKEKHIAELQEQMQELLQREEHYRRFVEDSGYFIYELDEHGYFTYTNSSFREQFCSTISDISKLQYWELIREDFREEVLNTVTENIKAKQQYFYFDCALNPEHSISDMWVGQHVRAYYEGDRCVRVNVISHDITKRKREIDELTFSREDLRKAYVKLKEQETQLLDKTLELELTNTKLGKTLSVQQAILSSAEISIISTDLMGEITEFNETAEKWLGYDAAEVVRRKSPDLFHSHEELQKRAVDLRAEFGSSIHNGVDILHKLAELYSYYQQEWTYIRKDGSRFPVLLSISPIYDEDDHRIGFLHLAIDISLQAQTETKLSEALATQYLLTEHLQTAILFEDSSGRISFLNGRFIKLFGLKGKPESFSGQRTEWIFDTCADKVSNEAAWYQDINALLKHREQSLNKEFRLKNGIIVERDFLPVKEKGYITGHIWQFRDVTQRKEQEELLTQKQSELEAFVGAAPAAIAMFDHEMRYIAASERWLDDYQLKTKEFIGVCHYDLFPDTSQEWRRIHQRCLNGAIEREEEELLDQANGEKEWVKWEVRPWLNNNYQVGGIIILTEDITVRKKQEEELRVAKRKAEEASEAKAQFLSTMSHEIRTPMNAVIGMTQLLMQEDPKPDQVENLKTLQFAATNLLALINDILDFNKIEAGKISFESIDFSIQDLARGIQQSLLVNANQKGIDLLTEIDDKIPPVLIGDPVRIGQILTNLVGNAIKFTQEGHVKIKATLENNADDRATIHFAVEDTGIGIPKDKQEVIFERFSQAATDTTRKFGGTGLGLAITKRLLELQDSRIQVDSEMGKGSSFHFVLKLPVSENTSLPDPAEQNDDSLIEKMEGIRILLVEDNEVNRIVASKFLTKWKTELDFAINGAEAVKLIQDKEFDIVLMDLQMPIMDGYEATRKVREIEMPYFQDLPIIAMTAEILSGDDERIREAGMNGLISKPFMPHDLMTKILRKTGRIEKKQKETKATAVAEKQEQGLFNWGNMMAIAEGKEEFIISLTQSYIRSLKEFRTELKESITEHDHEKLRFATHRVKSSLRFLEMVPLEEAINEIKHRAAHYATPEEQEALTSQYESTDKLTATTIEALKEQLGQYSVES